MLVQRPAVALLAALALLLGAVPSALGDPKAQTEQRKSQVDSDVAEMAEDLAGTSSELTGAYQRLAEARGQLPAARAALERTQAAQAAAERTNTELAGRLAAATQAQSQASAELAESTTAIASTQNQLGRLAAAAYRRGVATSELSVVMQAESPDDFADRFVLADTVLRVQGGTVNDLTERQAVQRSAQTRLAAVQGEVADLREQARQALIAARAARAEAAARKADVDALVANQTSATAAIEARKAEEESQLAELKAEQSRLSEQLAAIAAEERAAAARAAAAKQGSAPAPQQAGGGTLARPVQGRVTSSFGYRMHPIYHYRRLHTGTDFGVACGTPVYAAADGRVISAGWAGGYGNRIVVAHGLIGADSIATTYNHLSSYVVRSGTVSRGELIAYSGTTGASTGCHLHFEVLKDGSYVNPMSYL